MLLMGLRLRSGVERQAFIEETGAEPEALLDPGRLARLVEGGFLVLDAGGLRATQAGRARLDAVLAALLA
jgi:coproporphyrinogen III oxidase-like Fe-S oxidoreductase